MEFKGIDVSKWQNTIDFTKAKKNGVEFVMIRIGSGFGQKFCLDTKFKSHYTEQKKLA